MTPFRKVNEAFLSRILEDEWQHWMLEEAEQDWYQIMINALTWFKFPRTSLEINEEGFINVLSNEEIQIIATFMMCEWVSRTITNWENLKPLYEEKDFSHAILLDKLKAILETMQEKAAALERIYYRSIKREPFDFTQLASSIE